MKRMKLVIPLALLAVLALAAFKFTQRPEAVDHKIEGAVYVLPKEFLLNLDDGRYAKLNVALVLAPGQTAAAGGHGGGTPPEGFGPLEQEAVVRDVVTDVVTNEDGDRLITPAGRERVKREILAGIRRRTDVRVDAVLLPDVAVQ